MDKLLIRTHAYVMRHDV